MNRDIKNTKEYIEKYIESHATSVVAKRGKQMYRSGKVDFEDFSEKTNGWSFSVHGTMKYRIVILGVEKLNIEASCTCPFDWGNLCKHSIAAMSFISDNLGNQFTLLESKKGPSHQILSSPYRYGAKEGYELNKYKNITGEFIKENTPPALYSQLYYNSSENTYANIKINENSIVFLPTNHYPEITIYSEEGKVYISSLKKTYSKLLTLQEAQCLYVIAKSKTPNILDQIFSGELLEKQKEILSSYGLNKDEKFEDYFHYSFDKRLGLTYEESEKVNGLIPISNTITNNHLKVIDDINNDTAFLNELNSNTEERKIGFVIKEKWDYYHSYFDENENLEKWAKRI